MFTKVEVGRGVWEQGEAKEGVCGINISAWMGCVGAKEQGEPMEGVCGSKVGAKDQKALTVLRLGGLCEYWNTKD